MSTYRYDNYTIVEANGRYGLAGTQGIILEPIYTSLVITNQDKPLPEYKLKKFEDDPYIDSVGELNTPIVIADGKQGLINSGKLISELKYERIITLTFCDYLCLEEEAWTLFHIFGWFVKLLATRSSPGELTLESLLQSLATNHPEAFAHLSERLHKSSTSHEYISEYRRYGGIEFVDLPRSDMHFFIDSTERVVVHDDFRITYLDTIKP